jgi:hypothetical protein
MTSRMPIVAVLAMALAGPAIAQQAKRAPQLTDDQRTLLHCSATFALVATRQKAKDPQALAFPDVTERGREYFVRAMVQLMDQAGLDEAAIRSLATAEASRLLEPTTLYKQMPACLASLQASGL